LVIANESEPRVGPSAVNNWLFERKLREGGESHSGGKSNGSVPTYTPPPALRGGGHRLPDAVSASSAADSKHGPPVLPGSDIDTGPIAWHGAEMGGNHWSDNYSFLGDMFTAEKGVNPIVRNFELLGVGSVSSGSQQPRSGGSNGGGSSGGQRSAKEDRLLREFEAFSKSRDMEFSGPRRIG
jgi:hypothetical protein